MTQALPLLARTLLALAFSLALTPALAADSGPAAPVTAIYKRVVASYDGQRGNTENGYFIWKNDKTRRQYFSARTAKLWREADRLTPPRDSEAMIAAIPDAEYCLIQQAGHLSNIEDPDRFNSVVLESLLRRTPEG